jgi:hypothetical protein
MNLEFQYEPDTLAGADPRTLAIFAWDATNKHWDNLGGTLVLSQEFLAVNTSSFTAYVLMATPTWRDEFDDLEGLASSQNVEQGGPPEDQGLILLTTPGSGQAISGPITPPSPFGSWGQLIFTGSASPPATQITVDVLTLAGTKVITNVSSDASLAHLNPSQYPALRLQANLTSTVAGQTPVLTKWQLSWQMETESKIYLPVVLK